jgi:dTDP-glucose 4,6-dehydratase
MTTQGPFLVIGSNCFTGSHIVDALLEAYPGHEVVGTSRSPESADLYLPYKRHGSKRFHYRQIDFLSQFDRLIGLVEDLKPGVVVNVAALSEVGLSNERPVEYFETNTLSVVQLCNHLRTRPWLEQYVHISSAEVYGPCSGPVTEHTPFNPSTPYAVSKAAADMYLKNLIRNFGFPATLVRSTNVYGKHQQLFKIIPRTAIFLKQGKTIELHGGGTSIKSFIHIRDVVAGLLATLKKRSFGTYLFSVPSEQTVAEIVRFVCSRMGFDFERSTRVVGERLGQDSRYWLDCRTSSEQLGWSPRVSFEDGVDETITWIEENWARIQAEPLHYIHKCQGARAA